MESLARKSPQGGSERRVRELRPVRLAGTRDRRQSATRARPGGHGSDACVPWRAWQRTSARPLRGADTRAIRSNRVRLGAPSRADATTRRRSVGSRPSRRSIWPRTSFKRPYHKGKIILFGVARPHRALQRRVDGSALGHDDDPEVSLSSRPTIDGRWEGGHRRACQSNAFNRVPCVLR